MTRMASRDASTTTCLRAAQVSVRLAPVQDSFGSSTIIGQVVSLRRLYASVYDDSNFSSPVASLFSWQCQAAPTSSFLQTVINLISPSVTASTHTSASNAIAFQFFLCYAKRPDVALYAIGPVLSALHPQGFRTRFPLATNRPPLIRMMSAPAHKSLIVRNVISMLSHRVISRARLYEFLR